MNLELQLRTTKEELEEKIAKANNKTLEETDPLMSWYNIQQLHQ